MYSGWRATLFGQVIWGMRSGIASWKIAAHRQGFSRRKSASPGRSASQNNSEVSHQSSRSTPAEFRRMVEREIKRWREVITKVNIPLQD